MSNLSHQLPLYQCVVYLSPTSWGKACPSANVHTMRAAVYNYLSHNPNIVVTQEVVAEGKEAPFDQGFQAFENLITCRNVNCVAIYRFDYFATNAALARFWLRGVLSPLRVRFIDVSRCFDSAYQTVEEYLKWRA